MSMAITAIAVTSAVGIYSAYQQNEQGKATAKGIEAQAKVDRDAAQRQMDMDAREEGQKMTKERRENRRLRAQMEAAYAGSGVLMEGSAADVMVKQRQVNEANVQNIHVSAGNQRAEDTYKMKGDYAQSIYMAKSAKYAAKQAAITTLVKTAAGAAVGAAGLSSGAAASTGGSAFNTASTAGSVTSASSGVGLAANSSLAGFGGLGASTGASFGQTASFGMMTPVSILGNTATKSSFVAPSMFAPSAFNL